MQNKWYIAKTRGSVVTGIAALCVIGSVPEGYGFDLQGGQVWKWLGKVCNSMVVLERCVYNSVRLPESDVSGRKDDDDLCHRACAFEHMMPRAWAFIHMITEHGHLNMITRAWTWPFTHINIRAWTFKHIFTRAWAFKHIYTGHGHLNTWSPGRQPTCQLLYPRF